MADMHIYKCKKCGYEVKTEPNGHYSLMMDDFYNFKCSKCKNIVSISVYELYSSRRNVHCPTCRESGHLSTWNPIDCKCPKCNWKMTDTGIRIDAD